MFSPFTAHLRPIYGPCPARVQQSYSPCPGRVQPVYGHVVRTAQAPHLLHQAWWDGNDAAPDDDARCACRRAGATAVAQPQVVPQLLQQLLALELQQLAQQAAATAAALRSLRLSSLRSCQWLRAAARAVPIVAANRVEGGIN